MNTRCPPKRVPSADLGATASEDNAALGSLLASPQASSQTTGVAGARFQNSKIQQKNNYGKVPQECLIQILCD
ncbi:UNVERIFIED_CONTAM: hypothetical protein FKN15_021565 [Acipenser sinensis]